MVGKIYVNRKNDGMFNNFEKCIEAIFPTAGGVTGSLLSITAGNSEKINQNERGINGY